MFPALSLPCLVHYHLVNEPCSKPATNFHRSYACCRKGREHPKRPTKVDLVKNNTKHGIYYAISWSNIISPSKKKRFLAQRCSGSTHHQINESRFCWNLSPMKCKTTTRQKKKKNLRANHPRHWRIEKMTERDAMIPSLSGTTPWLPCGFCASCKSACICRLPRRHSSSQDLRLSGVSWWKQ